jgi:hypothetical protein
MSVENNTSRAKNSTRTKRILWFVGLWLAGVAGAFLLTLPFHLLVEFASH